MRDRLVALGMRRPTRVKDEDYDVPMLTEEDFEIGPLSENITIIPMDCTLVRDAEAMRQLAQMCIAKAKLCLCISHVLTAQYSVLVKAQGMQGQEGNTRSSVMLFPKKMDQTGEVKRCDEELKLWVEELPECCANSNEMTPGRSGPPVFVQRSLLHMVYYTTLSALHRPQVLPSASSEQPDKCRELQDHSRKKVREASKEITRISQALHTRGLERYLPTTGVTVLLPAIIIHLLDIKASNDDARQAAMEGFCQCMQVLEKLRDNYASADFATQFLEAAIRKADIEGIPIGGAGFRDRAKPDELQTSLTPDKVKKLRERSRAARHTPPLSSEEPMIIPQFHGSGMMDIGIPIGRRSSEPNAISAPTPPDSDTHTTFNATTAHDAFTPSTHFDDLEFTLNGNTGGGDIDMSDFLNFDNNAEWSFPLEQGAHGESGGFMGDMNWIDQGATSWSRLNSPMRDLGERETGTDDHQTNWGGEHLRNQSQEPQEIFGMSVSMQQALKVEVRGAA